MLTFFPRSHACRGSKIFFRSFCLLLRFRTSTFNITYLCPALKRVAGDNLPKSDWRNTTMKAPALFTVAIFLGFSPVLRAESPGSADVDFFEKQVRPLLVEHCYQCHGNGKSKGELSLTSRASILKGGASGPAVRPNDPAGSLLIQAVRYEGETRMPPKKKLPDRAIAVLSEWVQRGAPWPAASSSSDALRSVGGAISAEERAFGAFQPIADPPLPELRSHAEWVCK